MPELPNSGIHNITYYIISVLTYAVETHLCFQIYIYPQHKLCFCKKNICNVMFDLNQLIVNIIMNFLGSADELKIRSQAI